MGVNTDTDHPGRAFISHLDKCDKLINGTFGRAEIRINPCDLLARAFIKRFDKWSAFITESDT